MKLRLRWYGCELVDWRLWRRSNWFESGCLRVREGLWRPIVDATSLIWMIERVQHRMEKRKGGLLVGRGVVSALRDYKTEQ